MTQQPYGQPQYPQQPYAQPAPQAPYAPPVQQPYAPPVQQAYPQPQAPYYPPAQPAYGQQPPVPQAPRADPSQINLAAFEAQPSGSGGPGLKFPQIGTGYVMTVERDVRDADVQQDTQPANQGGAPKFYRDGRPQLVVSVPVLLDSSTPVAEAEDTPAAP